eukprot:scaffold62428_cov58-Attheya_sp.AAC.3
MALSTRARNSSDRSSENLQTTVIADNRSDQQYQEINIMILKEAETKNNQTRCPMDLPGKAEVEASIGSMFESEKFVTNSRSPHPELRRMASALGDRINKTSTRGVSSPGSKKQHQRLAWITSILICLSLFVVYGLIFIIIEFVIVARNPDLKHEKRQPYEDIVKDTIPFIEIWYRSLNLNDEDRSLVPAFNKPTGGLFTRPITTTSVIISGCLERVLDDVQMAVPYTSPIIIERISENMGLSEEPRVRAHLGDLLVEPQPLADKYAEVLHCTSMSAQLMRLACIAEMTSPWEFATPLHRSYLGDTVHSAIVWDTLTTALLKDLTTLKYVAELMTTKQLEAYERTVEASSFSSSEKELSLAKYQGIGQTLHMLVDSLSANRQIPYIFVNSSRSISLRQSS